MKRAGDPISGASKSGAKNVLSSSIAIVSVALVTAAVLSVVVLATTGQKPRAEPPVVPQVNYPIGVVSATEPSGFAPPGPTAIPGFALRYVNNFNGTTVPTGWTVFTGTPSGAPGGQFGSAHVIVSHGELQLNTWPDPKYQNRWVTGGLCHCGMVRSYGAYFVRSRITGVGPNEVMLLWPQSESFPPEIDFNENEGRLDNTSSTVHWGSTNQVEQHLLAIDMSKWHTWGVVWTPTAIEDVVDGKVWASVTRPAAIARVPMRLDLEQRTMCQIHLQCPKKPSSMYVDWVAEYSLR